MSARYIVLTNYRCMSAVHLTSAHAGQQPGCAEQPMRVDAAHTKGASASRLCAATL